MSPKKVEMPPRIQGTDGIRRTVLPSADPSLAGLNPAEAFIERDVLTEGFLEGYAFAFAETVRERAGKGARVLVAWDPRDPRGLPESVAAWPFQEGGCRGSAG